MRLGPFARLLQQALDVFVELTAVDPPHAAPTDLDGGQLAGAHQRVDLGVTHVEIACRLVEGEEAGLHLDRALGLRVAGHAETLAGSIALGNGCVHLRLLGSF